LAHLIFYIQFLVQWWGRSPIKTKESFASSPQPPQSELSDSFILPVKFQGLNNPDRRGWFVESPSFYFSYFLRYWRMVPRLTSVLIASLIKKIPLVTVFFPPHTISFFDQRRTSWFLFLAALLTYLPGGPEGFFFFSQSAASSVGHQVLF